MIYSVTSVNFIQLKILKTIEDPVGQATQA